GGHPDLLAQLSSALEAPVQQVRAIVQPVTAAAPPAPVSVATPTVFLPEPLPAPFVLSVDIAAPDDAVAPVDDPASAAPPADDAEVRDGAPVTRFAAPVRLVAPAVTDDAEAPTASDDVEAASVDDAPPPSEPVVEAAAPPPAAAPVRAAAPAPAPVVRQS